MKVHVALVDQLANAGLGRSAYRLGAVSDVLKDATVEALSERRLSDGKNAYHLMAANSYSIPVDKLNEKVLLIPDHDGNTPLHYIGGTTALNNLPARLMTTETLFVKNNKGATPLTNILSSGGIKRVPARFITKETLLSTSEDGQTNLYQMAKFKHFADLPAVFKTQAILETRNPMAVMGCEYEAATIFHALATSGSLDEIPEKLLTDENMALRDHYNRTPIHYAALNRKLSAVEPRLLTQESVTKRDLSKRTVLHIVAVMEDLGYIPLDLLTPANLALENKDGESVVKLLSQRESWKGLPPCNWQKHEYSKHVGDMMAWRILFEKNKLPLPPALLQEWAPMEKDGDWQQL